MMMDSAEILHSYNAAKEKKKQIVILSELNACKVEEIIEILIEQGIERKVLAMMFSKRKPKTQKEKEPEVEKIKEAPASAPEQEKAGKRIIARVEHCALELIRDRYDEPVFLQGVLEMVRVITDELDE